MATLNISIPRFYCLLRKEFLYDGKHHHGEYVKVCVFGIASIHGRALGWRLPIHALCHLTGAPIMPLDHLQIWDCFSYDVTATCFDRLSEIRLRAYLKDKQWYEGRYLFTIDWYNSEDAEEAGEGGHKCAHLIALDNGNYAALPNNCLQWLDPAFVIPYQQRPDFLINTHIWKVEQGGITTDEYCYEMKKSDPLPS